tara:strand:+ start:50 stop:664 length:615 start_codon:yes stop_codon:yes gene_type:complete
MKVLDLCSGLGGFSEAFLMDRDAWEVMRIENNPLLSEVPNTEIIDLFEFRDTLSDMIERGYRPDKIDLILFSPPCREFSLGFHAPQAVASREGRYEEYSPDMSILEAGLEIIKMLEPRFYIIENVKGSIRHFEPYVGPPVCSIGSFWFYGNFPPFIVNEPVKKKSQGEKWSNHPLRENYRALIPLPISKAIKQAVESQTSLFNF